MTTRFGNPPTPRPCRPWAVARLGLLLGLIPAACRGSGDQPVVRLAEFVLPCEEQGYPCTWNEVDPEITARTKLLAGIAARYSISAPSVDSIAGILERLPGMAEVAMDGSGVRFRLQGGRPAWVFMPNDMDHHRPVQPPTPPRVGHRGSAPASMRLLPEPGAALASLGSALGAALAPRPLHAALAAQGERVVGEPGEGKKALILSPFDHEWAERGYSNSLGADFARRARIIKDYREIHGGTVTYRGDLSKLSDNPANPGSEQMTLGGESMLSGEVVFDDFLGWDTRELNLIVLASHGTAVNCIRRAPTGGRPAERFTGPAGTLCPLIYAGRAKQEEYGDYHGVEIYMAVNYSPTRPPDPVTRYDTPGETGWRPAWPKLDAKDAASCANQAAEGNANPMTSAGEACGPHQWEHDYPYLVLWWPFFREQYPNGLEKAIVFLGACFSGVNEVLLDILAPPGNEAVTVFGFAQNVSAGDAWDVIGSMLDLVDDGYHSAELVRQLKTMDRTKHLVGKAMGPEDQTLPARPAAIMDTRTHPTHGRDVVQLVDPVTGKELTDSGMVMVLGAPGDGRADSLRLRPRIIGVAAGDAIDRVRLGVAVRGSGSAGRRYVPNDRVRAGVHQHDGDVELGRDFREGERVDLEIEAELAGGGVSRWVYRGVRLTSSYWSAAVATGRYPGTFSGWRGKAQILGKKMIVTLESEPAERPSVLVNINAGANPLGTPRTVEMCQVEVAFSPSGNLVADIQANRAANVCSGGPTETYPPAAIVEIRQLRDGWVEGWAEGVFFRGHPNPADPAERGPVRIDFRVPIECAIRIAGRCIG